MKALTPTLGRTLGRTLTGMTLTAGLLFLSAGAARADDPPVTGSNSGLDQEEDDLLGGDLLGESSPKPATSGVAIPPPELKRQIDKQIADLAARSDAVGDELFVELASANASNAEIERRIQEAETRYRDLSMQVNQLALRMEGEEEPAPRAQGPRGYGTPLVLGAGSSPMADLRNRPYDPLRVVGKADPQGRQQLKWWEELLVQLAAGVSDVLKVLSEKRTNGLKAEADSIALGTDPRYRPYVDAEVRKAVSASAMGSNLRKGGADPRLNDLSLGGSTTPAPAPNKIRSYEGSGASAAPPSAIGPMPTRYLLEVKRDPVTGVERPVVALPLGAPSR